MKFQTFINYERVEGARILTKVASGRGLIVVPPNTIYEEYGGDHILWSEAKRRRAKVASFVLY